ncbi:MAG: 16S rRNA (uracil(1498)-N(3))-methyltransferase [Legionella sp.]|nr:MAG: 16S rRNA (uracil(1498)-N(3))-methyltransferase [Legionella sp.]
MRTIRIYQPGTYQPGEIVSLSESAAQHVGLVLRMPVGAELVLFRGDNCEFSATISLIHKKTIQVHIDSVQTVNRQSPRAIHLAQAIAKGDKMEWIIQKAVELGVTSITPLTTERCVVRLDETRLQKKQLQWQAIAVSACEQSGRTDVPVIYPACSLEHYLTTTPAQYRFVLSPMATQSWPTLSHDSSELTLLIGPEGGFSEHEIQLAVEHQAHPVRLGPRILRTETAAIVALGMMQMLYGDLS